MNDAANTYDPKAYWDTRAHPNTEEAPGLNQHDQSFMGSRLEDVQSVLEIGPGVGRLFPLYRSIPPSVRDVVRCSIFL